MHVGKASWAYAPEMHGLRPQTGYGRAMTNELLQLRHDPKPPSAYAPQVSAQTECALHAQTECALHAHAGAQMPRRSARRTQV